MGLPAVHNEDAVDRLGPDELGRSITLLASQINCANHRLLKLIAAFDRSGGWRCDGAVRSCAHWLAANTGIDLGAAREKVRVARRLEELPELDVAFSQGDLSYSKVRAVTRVATEENEGFLLGLAEKVAAGHLERLVSRYEPVPEVELPAGAEVLSLLEGDAQRECPEAAREAAREMFWFQDADGMWVFHAKLPPEQGQLVMKALEAVARPLQEERQEDYSAARDARLKHAARAIAEKHRSGGEAASSEERVELERVEEKISAETFADFMKQVRADAFGSLVEQFLAVAPGEGEALKGLNGAERCQVVLHVDVNTLREQQSGQCCVHGHAHFEDKPWISAETARRISCDASLVTVLEDEKGSVLNVGRRSRIVPAHIRRALKERDGCCQFPGCSEARYVDAHHVVHWADGGETSLDNLLTLCRFHHARLHAGAFEIRPHVSAETPGTRFEFVALPSRRSC